MFITHDGHHADEKYSVTSEVKVGKKNVSDRTWECTRFPFLLDIYQTSQPDNLTTPVGVDSISVCTEILLAFNVTLFCAVPH